MRRGDIALSPKLSSTFESSAAKRRDAHTCRLSSATSDRAAGSLLMISSEALLYAPPVKYGQI